MDYNNWSPLQFEWSRRALKFDPLQQIPSAPLAAQALSAATNQHERSNNYKYNSYAHTGTRHWIINIHLMKCIGIPLCGEWGCVLTHLSRQRIATLEAVSGVELAYRTIALDTLALTWIPLRTFEKANVNCLASSRVFTSSRSYSHKKNTDNVFRYNNVVTGK